MKRFTQKQKDDLVQGVKSGENFPLLSGENCPVVGYLGTNLEFGTWVDE